MKTLVKILSIDAKKVGEGTIAELGLIYPDGRDGLYFECQLPWEDERVHRVIACLEGHGFVPHNGRRRAGANEYLMAIERTYDRSDLDSASCLNLRAKVPFRSYTRSSEGLIELDAEEIQPNADIAYASPPWTVVSRRLKDLIGSAGMSHVVFRETRSVGSSRLKEDEGQFWELTSDFVLPPMSPRCKFIDGVTGEEVAGDTNAIFVLREGLEFPDILYTPAEIRYVTSAIEAIEPFDLALTHETFGGQYSRMIIASQRFYRFCVAHDLKISWTPVRIDEG